MVRSKRRPHFAARGYEGLFDLLKQTVSRHRRIYQRKGRTFAMNHPWLRDNIHEMKGYKYWEEDLAGFIDMFIELQHEDGFFYEIIGRSDHDHLPMVAGKHKRIEPDENLAWIRLELEADIEYLMVEAAYTAWQAAGDDAAMRRRLPALAKGLRYMMTDPTRWDAQRGLVKRTFTIDTWDFTYGVPDTNRRIESDMPMGIMHGDNSGLYQACRQLATMYRAEEQHGEARQWEKTAADLRERTNRTCYNGRYYTHQILLQPVDTGVKEEDILSLSNTYDINRELPTHKMAVHIIDEYRERREQRADTHFAEWFSIDPPYPKFGPYQAGKYINGGIASFVAGELAKAAFEHGREAYGADILRRLHDKVKQDGAIRFLYTADGKNQGGGPSGWGAAAIISAMMEGLAGIRDEAVLFREVTISPRFVAAGIDRGDVCASYGASGAYVAMLYRHDPASQKIALRLAGVSEKTRLRILLPTDAKSARAQQPSNTEMSIEMVEQSKYLCFNLPHPLTERDTEVVVQYE
jgi:hypothetical protein